MIQMKTIEFQNRYYDEAFQRFSMEVTNEGRKGWEVVSHAHAVHPETLTSSERHYFTAILRKSTPIAL